MMRKPQKCPVCGCKRSRKGNSDGTDAKVKVKILKDVKKKPMMLINITMGGGIRYEARRTLEYKVQGSR